MTYFYQANVTYFLSSKYIWPIYTKQIYRVTYFYQKYISCDLFLSKIYIVWPIFIKQIYHVTYFYQAKISCDLFLSSKCIIWHKYDLFLWSKYIIWHIFINNICYMTYIYQQIYHVTYLYVTYFSTIWPTFCADRIPFSEYINLKSNHLIQQQWPNLLKCTL